MTDRKKLREAAEKATPGPWGVWAEPTPSKDRAVDELAYQVTCVPDADFAEAVYLLNADGKCPATTGCGPTSKANANFIALANPQTIIALLDELDRQEPVAESKAIAAIIDDYVVGGTDDYPVINLAGLVGALAPSPAIGRETVLDEALNAVQALHEKAADERDRQVEGTIPRAWAQATLNATAAACAAIAALKQPERNNGAQP